jgi:hypothetical protein
MRQQSSNFTVYLALALAMLAAIASMPANGRDAEAKVLWLLNTQAGPDGADGNGGETGVDEAQMMGLP